MIRSNDRSFITRSQTINSSTRLFSECTRDVAASSLPSSLLHSLSLSLSLSLSFVLGLSSLFNKNDSYLLEQFVLRSVFTRQLQSLYNVQYFLYRIARERFHDISRFYTLRLRILMHEKEYCRCMLRACHVRSIFIERILFLSSRAILVSIASYFITLSTSQLPRDANKGLKKNIWRKEGNFWWKKKPASRLMFSAISILRSNVNRLREFQSRLNISTLTPS